jgi:SAM-dependent methyltransferase
MNFGENDLKNWDVCPWCNSGKERTVLYKLDSGTDVVKCNECGLVYSSRVLNEQGLKNYWSMYESRVHNGSQQLTDNRKIMYQMEYNYISSFLDKKVNRVLDVGCGGGEFLSYFKQDGNICEGVEFGEEAAKIAGKESKIYVGSFPEISFDTTYDLIIFRGTIQYFQEPKDYFNKALQLLNKGGYIFITSSPNSNSVCFNLFKENYNQKVCETDYCMYNEEFLNRFFEANDCSLVGKTNFYRGTPYENYEQDIVKVAEAIKLKASGKHIDFTSPAFFDNMLTLVYRKGLD